MWSQVLTRLVIYSYFLNAAIIVPLIVKKYDSNDDAQKFKVKRTTGSLSKIFINRLITLLVSEYSKWKPTI